MTLGIQVSQVVVEFLVPNSAGGVSITCGGPPVGTVGTAYSHTFPASGGTPPYTFSIVAGSLPTGLSLDSSTGTVSGTPTTAGTFSFTVEVTDSTSTSATVDCSILINPAPPSPSTFSGARMGGGASTPGFGGPSATSQSGAWGPAAYQNRCCTVPYVKPPKEKIEEYDLAVPLNGQRVFASANLPAPATSAVSIIGQYAVPLGFWFQLVGLVLNYFGAGWIPGDGNVTFSLDINTSGNPGSNAQGIAVQDYSVIQVPLGSLRKPWPVRGGSLSKLSPRDILRAKVQTNPLAIPPGVPNRFVAAFVGYLFPVN